jgi:hypothetical protein
MSQDRPVTELTTKPETCRTLTRSINQVKKTFSLKRNFLRLPSLLFCHKTWPNHSPFFNSVAAYSSHQQTRIS